MGYFGIFIITFILVWPFLRMSGEVEKHDERLDSVFGTEIGSASRDL